MTIDNAVNQHQFLRYLTFFTFFLFEGVVDRTDEILFLTDFYESSLDCVKITILNLYPRLSFCSFLRDRTTIYI